MPLMTDEEFKELWDERGLKYRLGEFYDTLKGYGLRMNFQAFLSNSEVMIREFLVQGLVRKDPGERNPDAVRWWDRLMRK